VAAFLSAMRVFNDIAPPYTATVLVELLNHTSSSSSSTDDGDGSRELSVRVWYKNSTNSDELRQLTLPGQSAVHTE